MSRWLIGVVAAVVLTACMWTAVLERLADNNASAVLAAGPPKHFRTWADPDVTLGGGATLASVRSLIASDEPVVISVLGDSTGNSFDEWVYLWALHLAETRSVTYHAWDDATKAYLPAITLSSGGPAADVWNMSVPGQTADYPSGMVERAQPERPDLVIYNYGHNNTADNFYAGLYDTLSAAEARWDGARPSVAILQNPEVGATAVKHRATVARLRNQIAPALGLPVVDVWTAFKDAAVPMSQLVSNADGYGVHPSPPGSRVWAEAVAEALG